MVKNIINEKDTEEEKKFKRIKNQKLNDQFTLSVPLGRKNHKITTQSSHEFTLIHLLK